MDDLYHVCRWCKHYENGCCVKDNFIAVDRDQQGNIDDIANDKVELVIKEPETFYCKDWE